MLERLVANAVIYKNAEKRPIPKSTGNVIYFNRFTNFPTVTTKATEGEIPTQTYLSGTAVSATLYQLIQWTPVSDVLVSTAFSDIVKECVENMADTAATSVDVNIQLDLLSQDTVETPREDNAHISTWWNAKQGGISTLYLSGNGRTISGAELFSLLSAGYTAEQGHVLDIDKIVRTVAKLRAANVRPYGDGLYKAFIHPKAVMQIERTTEWQQFNRYTRPEVLDKGVVGVVAGAKIYETTNMYVTNTGPLSSSSTAISLAFSLVHGQGAFAVSELDSEKGVKIITKGPNQYDTSNPANQWSTIAWKVLMAAKTLNPNCGYFLLSAIN
jgi:N4-gp56 family major capsid protein